MRFVAPDPDKLTKKPPFPQEKGAFGIDLF